MKATLPGVWFITARLREVEQPFHLTRNISLLELVVSEWSPLKLEASGIGGYSKVLLVSIPDPAPARPGGKSHRPLGKRPIPTLGLGKVAKCRGEAFQVLSHERMIDVPVRAGGLRFKGVIGDAQFDAPGGLGRGGRRDRQAQSAHDSSPKQDCASSPTPHPRQIKQS